MEYLVFSDESYITAERYRSIGAFSFPKYLMYEIENCLSQILKDSNVSEFKWEKLKNAKYRFCGIKLYKYVCQNLYPKKFRIDVIIWDTHDSRHKIEDRDDIANFERMFFHLMKNLMTRRERNSSWYIFPDKRMEINWLTIQDCLVHVGKWKEHFNSQLFKSEFSEQFFQIKQFDQVDSHKEPCIQIADYFAGLAVFSKNHYEKYELWCEHQNPQKSLFDIPEIRLSNSERERFRILKDFDDYCKKKKLGVSLKEKRCLCTPDPNNPINFWYYIPQHQDDKAPVRSISLLTDNN